MNSSEPDIGHAMLRGALCRCPACGEGHLFKSYLKVVDTCSVCGEELYHHRADDMPAYIVITLVGHVVLGAMLWTEVHYSPPVWLHTVIWLPLTLILTLSLLPSVKGAIVGLQWRLRMHGFWDRQERRALLEASHAHA
jgi:uncharacterized protein (DUF983 family)